MDSNSIDELINIIVENTEIDEDTARSCILNELALVDDLYKKDFFAELSTTIYKGIGNKVTKVDDIVKVSQEIQLNVIIHHTRPQGRVYHFWPFCFSHLIRHGFAVRRLMRWCGRK